MDINANPVNEKDVQDGNANDDTRGNHKDECAPGQNANVADQEKQHSIHSSLFDYTQILNYLSAQTTWKAFVDSRDPTTLSDNDKQLLERIIIRESKWQPLFGNNSTAMGICFWNVVKNLIENFGHFINALIVRPRGNLTMPNEFNQLRDEVLWTLIPNKCVCLKRICYCGRIDKDSVELENGAFGSITDFAVHINAICPAVVGTLASVLGGLSHLNVLEKMLRNCSQALSEISQLKELTLRNYCYESRDMLHLAELMTQFPHCQKLNLLETNEEYPIHFAAGLIRMMELTKLDTLTLDNSLDILEGDASLTALPKPDFKCLILDARYHPEYRMRVLGCFGNVAQVKVMVLEAHMDEKGWILDEARAIIPDAEEYTMVTY